MLHVDFRSLIQPIGIVRMVAVVLTCICFALAASAGIPTEAKSHWAWCMFCWCFCCFTTLLILILEFTNLNLNSKVPISWEDFTMAFAMLATLMMFTIAIIYPTFFASSSKSREIGASAVSWLCFGLYAAEVWLVHKRPGETSGFLTTVPGLLKILETFITCIIFMSLSPVEYRKSPGTEWCVAVYSLCFIFSLLIIFVTIAKLSSIFPFSFDYVVISFNILAVAMYATAVVIWPLYVFKNNSRPADCKNCPWDDLVVVTFMTVINFLVYIGDMAYSVKILFFTQHGQE